MTFFISKTGFFPEYRSQFGKSFCLSIVVLLCLTFLPLVSHAEVNRSAFPDRGYPAPEFTLYDLDGKRHSLSEYKGRVVLLNAWATWCYPCLIEMPGLELLYKKFKKEKFAVLAISIDTTGPRPVKRYIEENNYTFPVLLSPNGVFQNLYRTISIPATFVIDKSGVIVSRIMGARQWDSPEAMKTFESLIND